MFYVDIVATLVYAGNRPVTDAFFGIDISPVQGGEAMFPVLELLLMLWLNVVATMEFLYRLARDKNRPRRKE